MDKQFEGVCMRSEYARVHPSHRRQSFIRTGQAQRCCMSPAKNPLFIYRVPSSYPHPRITRNKGTFHIRFKEDF